MIPLRDRIVSALKLQPMTTGELARALSVRRGSVYAIAQELKASGDVHDLRAARIGKYGRPAARLSA